MSRTRMSGRPRLRLLGGRPRPQPIYETSSIDQGRPRPRRRGRHPHHHRDRVHGRNQKAPPKEETENTHPLLDSEGPSVSSRRVRPPRASASARLTPSRRTTSPPSSTRRGHDGHAQGHGPGSHENFTNLCLNAHAWMPEIAAARTHACSCSCPSPTCSRVSAGLPDQRQRRPRHAPNIKNPCRTWRPSVRATSSAVPRVLEKIYNSADTKASGPKRKIFRWAAKVGDRLLLRPPRKRPVGVPGKPSTPSPTSSSTSRSSAWWAGTRIIVLGGALAPWLAHFYRGVGIPCPGGLRPPKRSARSP